MIVVNGGKPVGEESLLRQVNAYEGGKDGQDREMTMNGSLAEDNEEDGDDETGTEEEGEPGEEKENKCGKKQRNKLVKKVKVRTHP